MKVLKTVLLLAFALVVASCAGANPAELDVGAGFWRGLVHGWIAPITFVISLFNDDVAMYEVRNNGGWYNFGFLFGLSFWGGGGGAAACRGRPRRRRRADLTA